METSFSILLVAGVSAPFLCAALIALFWPCIGEKSARALSAAFSGISLAAALVLWGVYMANYGLNIGFAFVTPSFMSWAGIPSMGLNGVSMPIFAMAAIVGFAAVLWAAKTDIRNPRLYFLLLMVMQGGLMGAFASTNLLWMYMFHEFALVPTFIAMSVWGGAGKRMAAMQMAVYLTLGALISLIGIIAIYVQTNAASFGLQDIVLALAALPMSDSWQSCVFALLLFGLGTLVSLFPFYTWAPRTYSAAPTSFAMLHAGVLKKFGLYVLIQAAVPLLPAGCANWAYALAVLALFNVVYIGLVTMAQRDLKMMVSYSSVAHMGLCFLGIASMSVLGVGGAVLLMFGHGLSVALLFMLSNAVVNRTGEWNMLKMGGLYRQTPVLAGFFIAATLASLGLPGFANFWGELSILMSLWSFNPAICAVAATGIIISAIYGLRAVANIFMGEPTKELEPKFSGIKDMTVSEKIPAVILLAVLLFVGFYPKSITQPLDSDLSVVPAYNQSK